jgi:hypothetical protein
MTRREEGKEKRARREEDMESRWQGEKMTRREEGKDKREQGEKRTRREEGN